MRRALVILAVDPAKATGIAVLHGRKRLYSASVEMLPSKKHEHPGRRYADFRARLWLALTRAEGAARRKADTPDIVVIEWAEGMRSGDAMAMHGFIRTVVLEWAGHPGRGLPIAKVGPKKVKKHATGSGNANKEDMVSAARKRWRFKPKTHDEADALWVADYYRENAA